ncbi:MAG: polysaccharide biosynthesis C-terminal domain-containing protein [Oscillospiraceae bacterium]|nr:polysaccharide biosynthesis C-terminal domain-containing protein [Oscillospiraceae bacterium]
MCYTDCVCSSALFEKAPFYDKGAFSALAENRYKKLAGNTLLFAISSFSGKLLSLFAQPYITHAMDEVADVGITKLTSQCANLLIPLVGMGISYAVLRFGLEKGLNRRQVFTNGIATLGMGFLLMLLAYPLLSLIPLFSEYAFYLYLYVLVSCLRTLISQNIRSRQLNKLVAVDGILCAAATLSFYVLFLSVLKLGPRGYLMAIFCGDALSSLFMFWAGGLGRYIRPRYFDLPLLKQMLRYSLPLIPAQISFWVINASDLFFVNGLCEGYGGQTGTYWSGLLGTGYFLPTILVTLGTIFYEAWQLSAVTEEEGRARFFSKVFFAYQSVMFCCAAGIIWLCRPLMLIFRSDYYMAWRFVPVLTVATVFSCFNQFLNSIYMVEKKSGSALATMLCGAVANCILNWFFIKTWGPMGAVFASLLSYMLVFVLRVFNTRRLVHIRYNVPLFGLNLALLAAECAVQLADPKGYLIPTTLLCAAVCLVNLKGVWSMLQQILNRRRPKAG